MSRISATALVLLLLAAGCTADAGRDAAPSAGTTSSPAGTDAAGADVLAFTASTVQGDPVEGATYAGRDLMVWFWAPW